MTTAANEIKSPAKRCPRCGHRVLYQTGLRSDGLEMLSCWGFYCGYTEWEQQAAYRKTLEAARNAPDPMSRAATSAVQETQAVAEA